MHRLDRTNRQATEATVAAGEVTGALAEVRSRDRQRRRAGVRSLADVASPEANLALLKLLSHRSADVRLTALETLAERDADLARLAARAALSDSDSLVRNTAADTLAAVGTRLDLLRLELALQDTDWVVRATAADSLGIAGKEAARRALLKAMRIDPHPCVRRDAAFALSYAQDDDVVPDMEAQLAIETEEQTRVGLLSGLYALGQSQRFAELGKLLGSKDPAVRHAAVNAMRYSVRPDDIEAAIQVLAALRSREADSGVGKDADLLIADLTRDLDRATAV